jgi:hypothetical protein
MNVIEINILEHDVIAKVCQLWRIMLKITTMIAANRSWPPGFPGCGTGVL